jgi:hypothetical protein
MGHLTRRSAVSDSASRVSRVCQQRCHHAYQCHRQLGRDIEALGAAGLLDVRSCELLVQEEDDRSRILSQSITRQTCRPLLHRRNRHGVQLSSLGKGNLRQIPKLYSEHSVLSSAPSSVARLIIQYGSDLIESRRRRLWAFIAPVCVNVDRK